MVDNLRPATVITFQSTQQFYNKIMNNPTDGSALHDCDIFKCVCDAFLNLVMYFILANHIGIKVIP